MELNRLISSYNDLIDPSRVKDRNKFVDKHSDLLSTISESLNLKKLKVKAHAPI